MKAAIEEIIREAGKIARHDYYKISKISDKAPQDQVTDTDIAIEEFLKHQLSILFPESGYYGEEKGFKEGTDNRMFVLDPIDGTANFIFGVPHFAISLTEIVDDSIYRAMVYNPLTEDLFYADRETPSRMNGKPIHVSPNASIRDSFVILGFSAREDSINRYLQEWPFLFSDTRKSIALLSPSLNLCAVARGKSDAFIDFDCSFEGQAAGAYILKRAGGKVLNYTGEGYNFRTRGIIATNGRLSL